MMFVSFQSWILWKDFWRRWWGWVPPKALSPTAHSQLTGTRWLNLWFKNKHFNVQEPILKVLQTVLPDVPMAALEVCSKTLLWRIFSNFLPHVAHFAANFPKVLPRKQNLLYIYRHNRLRWPGNPRIWTRPVLKAWEPTGATKFFESRPISYLWIIMNLTYQTSIQISQDSFSVKVSPISFHSSRLMQRILLLLYFRW